LWNSRYIGTQPFCKLLHLIKFDGLTDDYQLLDPAPDHGRYGTVVVKYMPAL